MYEDTRIQFRRGSANEWLTKNTILASGEPGFDYTNKVLKIGDGTTAWLNLDSISSGSGGGLTESQVTTIINEAISGGLFDQDLNTTDSPTFVAINLPNGTTLAQGTYDNLTGGNNGISLNCYVGYELNWQGGRLKSTWDNGNNVANIYCDSPLEFQGAGLDNVQVDSSGITFSDGTTIDTANHNHTSSHISDFNNSVSGLLPVKNITSGSGISITSVSGIYTVSSIITSVDQAQSLVTTVFNNTGSPIQKFKAVYINGGQGDLPTIALASNSGEGTSSKTYAITYEQINHMSSGKVIVTGALAGVNTDQFNPTAPTGNVNGITLWLSTSGNLTTTKPTAPYHAVSLGTIVRTHQNAGVVEVKIQNGYELDELHNVKISGVVHNDVLVYNSGNQLWQNNNSVVFSQPIGITGASGINNIVKINQSDYDNLGSYDPNTIYFVV